MSVTAYYISKGYTPESKTTLINGLDTLSVWTPSAGRRVIATELNVSSNIGGTIAFYFDNAKQFKIAEYLLGASASISPMIGQWESTAIGFGIIAKVGASATDGWRVNLTGFEIPSSTI